MKYRLEHYDKDSKRIVSDAGEIVGFALRLSNDRWGVYDTHERKLTGRTHATPKEALAAYVAIVNSVPESLPEEAPE